MTQLRRVRTPLERQYQALRTKHPDKSPAEIHAMLEQKHAGTPDGDTAEGLRRLKESLDQVEASDPINAASGKGKSKSGPKSAGGETDKPAEAEGRRPKWIKIVQPRTLLDDCPVKPLGMTLAGEFVFLTAKRMLMTREARAMTKTQIPALFTPQLDYLDQSWPRFNKEGEQSGWDATKCAETLMAACGRLAIWDPAHRMRGRGAHRAADGGLVFHTGNRILVNGTPSGPDEIAGVVYPALPEYLEPAESGDLADDAARELLDLLQTWNWERGRHDALLLLGFIAAGLVGGALKVRPVVWITGEKGTGKSSLTDKDGVIALVYGRKAIHSSDATSAGLYQRLRHDTVLVAIDEIEAKADNRRSKAVIELARQAFSGAVILRGGADGEGSEFEARAPFVFSSINIPPLKPQDMARLAILSLGPLPKGSSEPAIDEATLADTGRRMLARWIDRWPQWEARLTTWRAYLIQERKFDRRAADQFGTLFAAADFMLNDEPPEANRLEDWAGWMSGEKLAEVADASTDSAGCAAYMLSQPSSYAKGGRPRTIGELVEIAVGGNDPEADEADDREGKTANGRQKFARVELSRCGIRILAMATCRDGYAGGELIAYEKALPKERDPGRLYLAVANQGQGVLEIFKDSDWQGEPGSFNPFTRALLRIDGARRSNKTVKFGGWSSKAALVPLTRVLALNEDDDDGNDG